MASLHPPGMWEVLVHVSVVLGAATQFAVGGVRFSQQFERGQQWDGYAPGLQPGLFGKRVDLSDGQWRQFRAGLPAMTVLFAILAITSRRLQRHGVAHTGRAFFYLLASIPFLGYLHGSCAAIVVALALANYCIAHAVAGQQWGAAAVWSCNLGMLLAARLGDGLRFGDLCPLLAILDSHRGIFRWEICFNLLVLRMLSFALDLHWRLNYGVLMYLAYVLYPPLYLAGPIITYQDFAWQLRKPPGLTSCTVACCAARFGADWLCLELLTHFLFFNSIAKHRIGLRYQSYGMQYGAFEMGMTAFWALCFVWLKFAAIWRFFRLAAMLDGIDPPENMIRCFANNYDIEGFWRGWHASYNQWLVRYLYVPLGGRRRRALTIWPVFLFVAIWHDIEWRMLGWAVLMCLALIPELLAKKLAQLPYWNCWRFTKFFRYICALGAAINIAFLMLANLLGFVLGLDGIKGTIRLMFAHKTFVASTFTTFFSAANIMFWLRRSQYAGSSA